MSTAPSFEDPFEPPPVGSADFSLYLWDSVRNRGIRPEFLGPLVEDDELRREFLVGARSMGYELVDLDDTATIDALAAMSPKRYPLQPQQLWIVDALNAAGLVEDIDEAVIEAMRRSSKTTTIFMWCHGRCLSRAGYQVTFSAQSGVKSSARLREWKSRLDRTDPDPEAVAGIPPWKRGLVKQPSKALARQLALFGDDFLPEPEQDEPEGRRFRILMGEVGKGIYYTNDSTFLVLKPDADAYRGEAGDISWIDEAQELDPETGADLMAGIIPLQDTREHSALVVSGTAGEVRVGPLWERIERLRAGATIAGADYCFPPDTLWETIENEDTAIALIEKHHPGVGTLTTLTKMRTNWRKMDKPKWAREYGSLWPETFGERAIPGDWWTRAAKTKRPNRPARVAFGVAIKPNGSVAAIVAAWRDAKGRAVVEVVDHRPSTVWMPKRLQELSLRYRGTSLAYDDIGEGKATAAEAARLRPKPRMRVQTYTETAAGSVQLLRELERGTLIHFNQPGLNTAVEQAAKRYMRNDEKVWLFTPMEKGGDITCLDAAVRALRNWDQHHAKTNTETGIVAA